MTARARSKAGCREAPRLCAFGGIGLLCPQKSRMVIVISPAKSLDFETPPTTQWATDPSFHEEAGRLIGKLRTLSKKKVGELMDISDALATLNVERYLKWEAQPTAAAVKQAILAFDGDVYQGMEATRFGEEDLAFAQSHLRILSGLYGLLRPLDRIQPHRLEMGTRLKVGRAKDLYMFWGKRIALALNAALEESGSKTLVNLASEEYFHSVDRKALQATVVTPTFLDRKGEGYKIVSFWAKKARGKMAAWLIANRIEDPEAMKHVDLWGYRYNAAMSNGGLWAFTRETPQP